MDDLVGYAIIFDNQEDVIKAAKECMMMTDVYVFMTMKMMTLVTTMVITAL